MAFIRSILGALTLGLGALATTAPVLAQNYPNRPVKMLVGFAPGGSIDIIARAFAAELTKSTGQPFVVENRPGASASIAMSAVAKSPPDGYTLGVTLDGVLINAMLMPNTPYNVINDFQPVGSMARIPMMMVVSPKVQANTFQEFVALAKAKPGTLNYASSGNASISHLLMEVINLHTGIQTTHVPYKGGAPGMTATLSGEIDAILVSAVMGMPHVKSGAVKPLVVGSPNRFSELPNTPTIAEMGNPKLTSIGTWTGLVAPAGTPRDVVEKINAELNRIARSPEMAAKLQAMGAEPFPGSVDDFARLQKAEMEQWGEVFRTVKIKVD